MRRVGAIAARPAATGLASAVFVATRDRSGGRCEGDCAGAINAGRCESPFSVSAAIRRIFAVATIEREAASAVSQQQRILTEPKGSGPTQ
jgi:hypothetical protein